jgi:excisionase family DNA binding protein
MSHPALAMRTTDTTEQRLLTKREAARFLHISAGSLERRMREIRHFKVGSLVRFKVEDLTSYLEKNARGGAAA